jgi:hypothetical protein
MANWKLRVLSSRRIEYLNRRLTHMHVSRRQADAGLADCTLLTEEKLQSHE